MVAITITIIYMDNKVSWELWPEPILFSLLWKTQRDPHHGLFSRAQLSRAGEYLLCSLFLLPSSPSFPSH